MTKSLTVTDNKQVTRQKMSEDHREYLYLLKTMHSSPTEICRKFNDRYHIVPGSTGEDIEGGRDNALNPKNLSKFFSSKTAKEEFSGYLQQSLYKIHELPFGSPMARVLKLGEILESSESRTREKIEALKQICNEQRYVEEKLNASRPEPIVLLQMEALDDEDPLLDTETFTKTKQLFIQMIEAGYGDEVSREIQKLIKTMRDNGGHFEWEEAPKIIEAEIIDGNS